MLRNYSRINLQIHIEHPLSGSVVAKGLYLGPNQFKFYLQVLSLYHVERHSTIHTLHSSV